MNHNLEIAVACCALAALPALAAAAPEPVASETRVPSAASILQYEVAALRQATAHLHRFENALAAGWDLMVTECKENPPIGGMGYHFGHEGFYLDGVANLMEPEILLYVPARNGQLRLVAVEYIVPLFAWQGEGTPRLFGRDMKWVEEFQEWQLHAWVWKHNPDGMFEDWNPTVNCDHAE